MKGETHNMLCPALEFPSPAFVLQGNGWRNVFIETELQPSYQLNGAHQEEAMCLNLMLLRKELASFAKSCQL